MKCPHPDMMTVLGFSPWIHCSQSVFWWKFWCLTIEDDSYYSWKSPHLVDATSSSKIPVFSSPSERGKFFPGVPFHRFLVVVAEGWLTRAFATDIWKSDDRPERRKFWDSGVHHVHTNRYHGYTMDSQSTLSRLPGVVNPLVILVVSTLFFRVVSSDFGKPRILRKLQHTPGTYTPLGCPRKLVKG